MNTYLAQHVKPESQRFGFRFAVVALIVGIHAYALAVFGATYWADSRDYIELAEALRSQQGLAEFYESSGRWIFSHLQPGVPIVWMALGMLPEGWRWPVLALFQHAVAAGALLFAFNTINRYWPTRLHLVTLLALLLLPAYQAFHGALLTESLTSSLLLIAFAACLRIAFEPAPQTRYILTTLVALALVTQFRSYWGLIIASMLFITLLKRKLVLSIWMPLLLLTAVASATAFPLYRLGQTGEFFLPQVGMNMLISGLQVNPKPSEAVRKSFAQVEFPPSIPPAKLFAKGLDAETAIDIGRFWRDTGLDNDAINSRAQKLGAALSSDGLDVQINRGIYGITSLGSVMIYALGDPNREVFRGMKMFGMLGHQSYYYRWHSWIGDADYSRLFGSFFGPGPAMFPFEESAKAQFKSAWEPYLSHVPHVFRDPLSLGQLPPDTWLLTGLAAIALLLFRVPFVTALVSCAIALAFVTAFWVPVGNTRYGNPLIPLYMLSGSILAASIFARGGNGRAGRQPPQYGR